MDHTKTPQVVPDMSGDAYHAAPGISSSQLKHMGISPRHYWAMKQPNRPTTPETAAFKFGRMVHSWVLEPHKFHDEYCICPADAPGKRSQKDKNWWVDWYNEAGDRQMVKEQDFETAEYIRDALMAHDASWELLNHVDGEAECSGWWRDERTKLLCKYRPDLRTDKYIVDLKTSAGPVDYDTFQRSLWNFGYHNSAAWYLDGDRECRGTDHETFIWIVVEKSYPFGIGVYYLDADGLELARRQNRTWLHQIAYCMEAPDAPWPQVNDGAITEISLPAYALRKLQ